jgi:uncharacterized protein YegP (UPF0339 family)
MPTAEVYPDAAGQWRWRLRAENHRVIADSGEGYVKQSDCLAGLHLATSTTPVVWIKERNEPTKEKDMTEQTPEQTTETHTEETHTETTEESTTQVPEPEEGDVQDDPDKTPDPDQDEPEDADEDVS